MGAPNFGIEVEDWEKGEGVGDGSESVAVFPPFQDRGKEPVLNEESRAVFQISTR